MDPSSTDTSACPAWLSIEEATPCLSWKPGSLEPLASDPSYCIRIEGMSIGGAVAVRFRGEPPPVPTSNVDLEEEGTAGAFDWLPIVPFLGLVGDVGEMGGEDIGPSAGPSPGDAGAASSSPAKSRTTPKLTACIRAWASASASKRL